MFGARMAGGRSPVAEAPKPMQQSPTEILTTGLRKGMSKFPVHMRADAEAYADTAPFGGKHYDIRHVADDQPLDWHTDVNIVFKICVETVIVLNSLQLGLCTHPEEADSPVWEQVCSGSDLAFTIVFTMEFMYKFCKMRMEYFKSSWNCFDFALLLVTYADNTLTFLGSGIGLREILILKLMRLFRILRIIRVLQRKKEMRMVLEGLITSFRAMIWVALLLGMLIYVASIICVTFFRQVETNCALNYQTIPQAMFAMFSIAIVADWTDIVVPVIATHWWSPVFFVVFIVIATFGVLNLIIGVITERTAQVQDLYRRREELRLDGARIKCIEEIADIMFVELHSHGEEDEPTITKLKMEEFISSDEFGPVIEHLMQDVSLPAGYQVSDCHAMFDRDATGTITRDEFVKGMGRMIISNDFQRSLIVQSGIADVLAEIKSAEVRLAERMVDMEKRLSERLPRTVRQVPTANGTQGEAVLVRQWLQETPKEPHKDLEACRSLLQRLREPLADLLAEDLLSQASALSFDGKAMGNGSSSPARQQQSAKPSGGGRNELGGDRRDRIGTLSDRPPITGPRIVPASSESQERGPTPAASAPGSASPRSEPPRPAAQSGDFVDCLAEI